MRPSEMLNHIKIKQNQITKPLSFIFSLNFLNKLTKQKIKVKLNLQSNICIVCTRQTQI